MSERNIFPIITNKIKGVDVVQIQKWGTVWNNPPAIDFGQIIGNLKLVDYSSVLSKEKMRKCLFPCFGSQQHVLTMGKSLPSFHFWVHTTFQQHRKQFFLWTLWYLGSNHFVMPRGTGLTGNGVLVCCSPPNFPFFPFWQPGSSLLLHWLIGTWTIALH